ncbi:ferredoxin reductase [Dokdonella sp.]|uniref:ferredoxin reductase n=1 Tax=Dokdonella sp. TaxID=2291710 RepID=UPI00352757C1
MNAFPATLENTLSTMARWLRHPLLAPFNAVEDWDRLVSALNPLWSLVGPRARVVRVVDEAPDVKSLWLKPNRHFRGFQPGQHVLLELDVDGASHARCFSVSSAPRRDGLLRLTIKRKDDGPVSTAAHALQPGQVVRLGQACGQFAARGDHSSLLLVAAGSGITPMMSLLHAWADQGESRDIALLYCSRSPVEAIFETELRSLAGRIPGLRVHLHHTQESGRLDADAVSSLVPDWDERETLVCGPDGFMQVVESMHADSGLSDRLQSESFGRRAAVVDAQATEHAIRIDNPEQAFTVLAGQSLLEGAEAAGLRPRFGCRRGICRTCQCRKRSGTVLNLLTGQVSGPGEELIQLCISTPLGGVELARQPT